MSASFPRQRARTRGFQLGRPRSFRILPGPRLLFLRSATGTTPVNDLWLMDGAERRIVDVASLPVGAGLPPEEQARRERLREVTQGITSFSVDDAGANVVFTVDGRGFHTDLATEVTKPLALPSGIVDLRINQAGTDLAYVHQRSLWRIGLVDREPSLVAQAESDDDSWGLADFIAAEELDRTRGYWWVGDNLLVTHCDQSQVETYWISNPSDPTAPPIPHRYPAAGTANARVELWLIDAKGSRHPLDRDHDEWPYLASVHDDHGVVVSYLTRDQRRMRIDLIDPVTGQHTTLRTITDPNWVDVHPGTPTLAADGALLTIEPHDGVNRLCRDGEPWSDAPGNVVALLDTTPVVLQQPDAMSQVLSRCDGAWHDLTPPDAWSMGVAAHDAAVIATANLIDERTAFRFVTPGGDFPIRSEAEAPIVAARPHLATVTERRLPTALLRPERHDGTALPVIMSPYGGPHGQRVIKARGAFSTEQWLADQGFAVVVVDGAGTPGLGPRNERFVAGDLAAPVLADQIAALHDLASQNRDLDLGRVGIRGWSFGGYLAALAVLDRPDVFHAAVAGAPVTDWRLYDTAYSERYLGDPRVDDVPYQRSDLITRAPLLRRPLLLIHGLADDNVVAAHTLQLSSALLAAGRQHSVLPLAGITHMTPQETIAENLLLLELEFFRNHLHGT